MGTPRSSDVHGAPGPRHQGHARLGPTDLARIWAIAIAAVATLAAIALDWESPLRVPLVLAFFVVVPGLALAELLDIRDPIQRLAIATGASLAIGTLIAVALIYTGFFSAETASLLVAGLTHVVLLAAVMRRGWRGRRLTHAAD